MMNIPNTLDIDENGRAIIEIPKIQQDYSFILNHWQSPQLQLKEIENDLRCSDSEERKTFLEKAKRLLSDNLASYTFDDNDDDDYDEAAEQAKIDEVWKELQNSDYDINVGLGDEEIEKMKKLEEVCTDAAWNFDEWDESEEEQEYNSRDSKTDVFLETEEEYEYANPQYLIVYNFRLKHSLAWYLMHRIDDEIMLIKQQIEKGYGKLKLIRSPNGIDEFIKLIRQACNPYEGCKKIMEYFQLSALQADDLMETKLRDITQIDEMTTLRQIELYNFIKSLLKKMK